jgi:hypothetical protein
MGGDLRIRKPRESDEEQARPVPPAAPAPDQVPIARSTVPALGEE